MRDEIVRKATDATFLPREAELKAIESALARKARNEFMKPSEITAVDKLPSNFFGGSSITIKDGSDAGSFYTCLNYGPELNVPYQLGRITSLLNPGELLTEIMQWSAMVAENGTAREDFRKQTKGVVYAFADAGKLLLTWPQLEAVMPPGFFAKNIVVNTLPVATINLLSAQMDLAMAA
jgi:hypothetical protein